MPEDVVEFGLLSDSQRAELEGDEADPFDAAGNTLVWRGKDRHVALAGPDGRLLACAGLVLAKVEVGGAELPVVGIGGVIVNARYRGQGLGRRIIVEALARAATMGPALAMLFCHRNRAGLYERHGFVEIPPPVRVEQPRGLAEMQQVAMWRPLREDMLLPQGDVVVRSLPF